MKIADSCPCCGSDDLKVGMIQPLTAGVLCKGCGLRMTNDVGDFPARRFRTIHDYLVHLTNKAITAWNRRTGPRKKVDAMPPAPPRDFKPVDLDGCRSRTDFARQTRAMYETAEDLYQRGLRDLARVYRRYAMYCIHMGYALQCREEGSHKGEREWLSLADETFDSLPDWAKWTRGG